MTKKHNKPHIINKKTTFIDKSVKFGKNVVVFPYNIIKGNTYIGDNTVISAGNYIEDSNIENNCKIEYSHIIKSQILSCCTIGPYSHIRPECKIGNNCKIGSFVEVKNATIGNGTKASHLAYIGDAEVGINCNIGCGAIFVNYNGRYKNKTKIGNNCFIGSNVNIVAPVNIADNTYICAGTTITKDTEIDDFVIGRARETIKAKRAHTYFKEN